MSQIIVVRNISQTAKLGHRLIKFRYGPHRQQQASVGAPLQGGTEHTVLKAGQQGSHEAIWDFQIPARWRRSPISEEECAIINNGGRI